MISFYTLFMKNQKSGFPRWLALVLVGIVLSVGVFILSIIMSILAEGRNNQYESNYTNTVNNYGGGVLQESPRLNALDTQSDLYIASDFTPTLAQESVSNAQLKSTTIDVDFNADFAKRGLVFEPSFKTSFNALYKLKNDSDENALLEFEFPFPQTSTEISNARLEVNGVEIEHAKQAKNTTISGTKTLGLYWEGDVKPGKETEITVSYDTVGLGTFNYKGIENDSGAQDFHFIAKILGTRDYDNTGTLSIDERNYITEVVDGKKTNGVELVWDKPDLFTQPNVAFLVATRVNPSSQLASIYHFMAPLYVAFIAVIAGMALVLKKQFGVGDMVLVSALYSIFFPFLHYLTSFNADPSVEIFSNVSSPINFSLGLYGAFAIAWIVVTGLIFYLLGRVSGWKFALGIGLPAMFIFMGFFPLALTIPEYKGLLVLFGIIAILAVAVQTRVSGKFNKSE
jgi:hypothetical protein